MLHTDWYTVSRNAIKEVYNTDWQLMCGLLAATSPTAHLSGNVRLANKAYTQLKCTGTVRRDSFIRTHYIGLTQLLTVGKLNGQKTESYRLALLGDDQAIVLDRWMLRYLSLPETISRRRYQQVAAQCRELARQSGMPPAHWQAGVWCSVRQDSKSYADYLTYPMKI